MKLLRVMLCLLIGVVVVSAALGAGQQEIKDYALFGGSNTDTTELSSNWVPIRGARFVIIKTWSTHVAFTALNADSSFSDSLTTFKVLFSDSILTAWPSLPFGADSIVLDPTVAATATDSVFKGVGVFGPLPINKQLRAPFNASGIVTKVYPITAGLLTIDQGGVLEPAYMRVKVTPLRRATAPTQTATVPHRIEGLKGFRMRALVVYENSGR